MKTAIAGVVLVLTMLVTAGVAQAAPPATGPNPVVTQHSVVEHPAADYVGFGFIGVTGCYHTATASMCVDGVRGAKIRTWKRIMHKWRVYRIADRQVGVFVSPYRGGYMWTWSPSLGLLAVHKSLLWTPATP